MQPGNPGQDPYGQQPNQDPTAPQPPAAPYGQQPTSGQPYGQQPQDPYAAPQAPYGQQPTSGQPYGQQPPYQDPYAQQQPRTAPRPAYPNAGYPQAQGQSNTLGLVSMILGIASIPLVCCLYLGVPVGIGARGDRLPGQAEGGPGPGQQRRPGQGRSDLRRGRRRARHPR